ncbi:MAG: DegV family protein [Oscillospiraceae bacterium]|nr:DegV family protein [Oscillospiraceae bacterium]
MLKTKIKLMTDSVSDIGKELADALGIHLLCMPVTVDGKPLREEVDFTKEEFYQMIDTAKEFPSTAQLTPFEILEAYEEIAAQHFTDLIYVTIGAGGSGTYANAEMARNQFYEAHPNAESRMKIHLVDGRNYTATYGYSVAEAAKKLARGASVGELVDYLEDWAKHAGLYFVPMTLKYVKRSGRVSAAAAFAGELLGLKPFCRIVNCKSTVLTKIRGEQNIIPKLVETVLADIQPHTPYIVMQGSNPAIAQELGAALTKALGYPPEQYCSIGAAICCNAGANVVGFVIKRKEETAE